MKIVPVPRTVSGKYEPPFTVASFATSTHSWPSTTPIPVTMPAPGACPSYKSQAASAFSSRKAESGSISRSIRSRAVSLPRSRWRASAFSPPPAATCAVRSCSSSTSCVSRSCRAVKASSRCACDVRTATSVSLSLRRLRRLAQTGGELVRQLTAAEPPAPVAGRCPGAVHSMLAPEPEDVLRGNDRQRGARGVRELDEAPCRLARVEPGCLALPLRQRLEPAARRVGVVRRRVDDRLLLMVFEPVRIARRAAECPLEDDHAGEAEPPAEAYDGRGDHAEVFRHERQLAPGRAEWLRSGTGAPTAVLSGLVPFRNRPVRDETAEMVDARHVDELEGAPKTLAPPAVTRCAVRAPVVQRIAPVLTRRGQVVRRGTRDFAAAEELRVREMLGASPRDVDRDVAEDAHVVSARVGAQRLPFVLEADLIDDRVLAGEGGPVTGPERMARDELLRVGGRHPRAQLGKQSRRARERRGRVVRRAAGVGRAERQDLPPRLSCCREPVDEPVSLLTESAARQRRRMKQDSTCAFEVHELRKSHAQCQLRAKTRRPRS